MQQQPGSRHEGDLTRRATRRSKRRSGIDGVRRGRGEEAARVSRAIPSREGDDRHTARHSKVATRWVAGGTARAARWEGDFDPASHIISPPSPDFESFSGTDAAPRRRS